MLLETQTDALGTQTAPRPDATGGPEGTHTPLATYRLQFNESFTLDDAIKLVPYLHDLGISHIYAAPIFKAQPHSTHGYDTADFTQLNPEVGTEDGLAKLAETLRAKGMGLVLDIVPNHMGIGGPQNQRWWDVLKRGQESPFAKFFDIDWNRPDPRLRGKVLAPVLGDRYHKILAAGELQLANEGGEWRLHYHEHTFPINPASLKTARGSLEEINADHAALDALLEQQFYRLTWYGHANRELNYRRFFAITTLAGVSIENEEVFKEANALLCQWLQKGWVDGLRVDHPDGLRDPEEYCARLRKIAPKAWIVVEKILDADECLPVSWPVAGDSGYQFLNLAGGLLVDPAGEHSLTNFYSEFTDDRAAYASVAREKKCLVMRALLATEVERLAGILVEIAARHWCYRDFSRDELSLALTELAACFPVYRSYVRGGQNNEPVSAADARHIATAASNAVANRPELPPEIFELLTDLLLKRLTGEREEEFVARFQQLTPPAAAKGVEDTAFYCYNRFLALNEVGGNPGRFGTSVEEFHRRTQLRQAHWPDAMLGTSTHDTKRSEDVRARLCLLSEIPDVWRQIVLHWSKLNERHRSKDLPDRNTEYFYYQTLVGAWPLPVERALSYMEKAMREAGKETSWRYPNENFESALRAFITSTLEDVKFCESLESFVLPMVKPGCVNSLAQTLLKLTAPGVPDIYQGNEIWDYSLVDPDNRRPVDFLQRQQLITQVPKLSAAEAMQQLDSGIPKLWLIRRVLRLRQRRPELFAPEAPYRPLPASGSKSAHAVIFQRGENLISIVPRLVIGLRGDWQDTTLQLPAGRWRAELTDDALPPGPLPLADALRDFPVTMLIRDES